VSDGIVRCVVLGSTRQLTGDVCNWCDGLMLVLYVGYSSATEFVDVERAAVCEDCETIHLTGPDGWAPELDD
jgi:hypothetical protein